MPRLLDPMEGGEWASGRAAIEAAAAWLQAGRILAHPTSTVYGLGGRPRPEIDAEIARLKGRPGSQPLILVAASVAEIERALPRLVWSAGARVLAARFWPGPLTLVLPDGTERGSAVRVEPHAGLAAVLQESGGVMTSTSLNRAGESPTRSSERALAVARGLGPSVLGLAFLDHGDLPPSPHSTMVSVTASGASLLREGAIAWADIMATLDADRIP